MVWGFYPKVQFKRKIQPEKRLDVIELLRKNMLEKKYKITHQSAYSISGRSRNFFRYYQCINVSIRIDEAGNLNFEIEIANAFFDFGLLKKHQKKLLKNIQFI